MERIGVLTFWGVPNYGAFAQAYALNKILNDYYKGAQVIHLAYLHPEHHKLYFSRTKPKLISRRLFPKYCIDMLRYIWSPKIRYPEFENDWETIPHITLRTALDLEECYCDVIVTGSDAIWEYSIPAFGDDEHLIGNRLNCRKLVSYAASFGNMSPNDQFKPFVIEGLKRYNAIAVRDATSREIVATLLSNDIATEVLDPTLVHDFKADKNIPEPPYTKYILVYGNTFPESLIRDVKNYAQANNLTIIGAGIAPSWCDARLTAISPLKWMAARECSCLP